jgi:hypothetical protein
MKTEEDDEFERIEMESGWRKRQIENQLKESYERTLVQVIRNETLEEVAIEFEKMNIGDTAASFAIFVRGLKR